MHRPFSSSSDTSIMPHTPRACSSRVPARAPRSGTCPMIVPRRSHQNPFPRSRRKD
ncbi:hypothetical protein BD413DRAFT_528735 [Trametes elegans]|nr:hypothetical protein BD413DRAFT_528735 [Trametes elegans]